MRLRTKTYCTLAFVLAGCATLGKTGEEGEQARPNPFEDVDYFVNPTYTANVEATAKRHPELAAQIMAASHQPTALWVTSSAEVAQIPTWLDQAHRQQKAAGKPVLSVYVVYGLPNRDCAASASAGELTVEQNGLERYQRDFIDPISRLFKASPDLPIVVVLEPDSLPNLATNLNVPKCAAARTVYEAGVAYAIKQLANPNVSIYLDAGHSGWLGWDGNRTKVARIFRKVIDEAGGKRLVRGFATNVSNYTHLSNNDGYRLEPTNPCPNELTFVKKLGSTLDAQGLKDMHFIIDTSRNGQGGIRRVWGNWCNIRGAGLGERPRSNPGPRIDAYFWVKPPGESDGVSDPSAPRFDAMCQSPESAKGAPQAGQWFGDYFVELVKNANPPLGTAGEARPVGPGNSVSRSLGK